MVYLAVALSAALGGFVQSITGFGAAVVMMTILPYFFTMAVAPSVSTSICLGLTVTLAWKLRKSIDLKLTLPPTLLYAAASVTAIRFIGSMDLRDARGENGVDGLAEHLLVVVGDGAGLGLDKAGDGTQRGGFARAVRADEGDDLAVGHLHVNAAQRLNAAVGDLKVLNFKHPLPPPDRRR